MKDPRITDYALGELDSVARETFEHELATSPELQQELRETIALAEALPAGLVSEDSLTDSQRDNLRIRYAENLHSSHRSRNSHRGIFLVGIGALAATVALMAVVVFNRSNTYPGISLVDSAAKSPVNPPMAMTSTPAAPIEPAVAARSSQPAPDQSPLPNEKIDKLVKEGTDFFATGRFDLAVKRSKMALQSDPNNVAARQLLGKVNAARLAYEESKEAPSRVPLVASNDSGFGFSMVTHLDKDSFRASQGPQSVTEAADATRTFAPLQKAGPAQNLASRDFHVRLRYGLQGKEYTVQWNESGTRPTVDAGMKTAPALQPMTAMGAQPASKAIPVDLVTAPTVTAKSEQLASSAVVDELKYPTQFDAPEIPQTNNDGFISTFKTEVGAETYDSVIGNSFVAATDNPLSTFSVDVDTASYSNIRRFLEGGQLPPTEAVRIEELVNYFPYAYPQPDGDAPFSVNTEVTHAPWAPEHLLARIALKGREPAGHLPASNLVFLIDVSGSMGEPGKLPLLKRSLAALVEKLSPRDRLSIVTYAGESGLALPATSGKDKGRIFRAIDDLEAGGSTNGGAGIELAYQVARQNFLKQGNNRVILCTDGDFNVGVTSPDDLAQLIEQERQSGVFLSVLGFGTGNLKDNTMESLADKGNGNYAYIDSASEGRKVLVDQMSGTLFTIARDVKIQVEFNPSTVAGYRLIGYEKRVLAKEDFNDDTKDAGEIGAGHTVTSLYEIVPVGQKIPGVPSVDPLKYQAVENPKFETRNPKSTDLFTVKLRYKDPKGDSGKLIEKVVGPDAVEFSKASEDFRFASAVAAFGMRLRADKNDPSLDWDTMQKIARGSLGEDPDAYRAEFLTLVEKAKQLSEEHDHR